MSDLIVEQFSRMLDGLGTGDPWPTLEASGFLDLLRSEDDGGAGLQLSDLFPLAFEIGRRPDAPAVIETMVARLKTPAAVNVQDIQAALTSAGAEPPSARALAAAVTAAQMAGALERLQELTIEYAGARRQFGREISKFQAIQQQISVMAEEVMAARMAAQKAFVGQPLEIAHMRAAAAKLRAGQAAQAVCAIAHAVHGAIGVSQEHPLHLFTGRLHDLRMAHGGESYWAGRLGQWVISSAEDFTTLAREL